jgi:hypothetical protein
MKKFVVGLTVGLLLNSAAVADPLTTANGMFEKKEYAQALKVYSVLASGGNAEAQQRLGEMYWYGEAGVVDDAVAEGWFRKAAAKGNAVAAAALEVMRKRLARKEDIAYWTTKYDGKDLRSGPYRCPAPRVPALSKNNEEIQSVADRIEVWQNCYNGFVTNLNKISPLFNLIPRDVLELMKQDELDKAKLHLAAVETGLSEQAKIESKLVLADVDAWRNATNGWVTEHNAIVRGGPSEERQQEINARRRNYAPPK